MRTITNLVCVAVVVILVSCEREHEETPQIVFKANNEVLSNDTLKVAINAYHELIIEVTGGDARYFRQVNSQQPIALEDTEDLRILSSRYGSEMNETVEVFTGFPDSLYTPDDVVRIKVQLPKLTKSIYYLIE